MGSPKDEAAKKQLDDLVADSIKPAMERYKQAHAKLKTAPNKLDAAIARNEPELIDFEARGLRKTTEEVGSLVDDINNVIGMLNDFADDPDLAGSKDAAARWVTGLGAAKKDLQHGVQKADHALAKAEHAINAALKHGGKLETAWAGVRSQVSANLASSKVLSAALDRLEADARAAGKKLDGDALEVSRKSARENDEMIQIQIEMTQSLLAAFDKELAQFKPSADFKAIYTREHQRANDQLSEIKEIGKGIRGQYTAISVMQLQYNFVKIAQSLGVPLDEAKKLAPALAQNDSGKLKALDALAKKHKLEAAPKQLLASLRKDGLIGRA